MLVDHLLKIRKECKNLKKKRDSRHIYQNELGCFQLAMVHEDFKYLPRRTTSDKVLRHKVFNIAKIQNMIDI